MSQFHDRTRRRICLAAFFALCIVPTIGLLAWGLSRQGSWHVDACAQRLSRQLALAVTIDRVEHPRPGVVRYVGVRVADPETDETICVCRRIEARRQDVNDRPRPALRLIAEGAEMRPRRADRFWQLLHRAMARRMSRDDIDVRLVAGKLALRTDSGDEVAFLDEVWASMQTGDDGGLAEFGFQIGETGSGEPDSRQPVQIHIRRDRKTTPPGLCFDVNARSTPIPCGLLGLLIPECEALGPDSRFQGYFVARREAQGWSGQIADGRLTDVDLASFFQRRFPDVLTGQATVTIQQANFSGGRLQDAVGSIAAGPGTISRAFFDNARVQLNLGYREFNSPPADAPDQLPYEILSLGFSVGHDGLRIDGTVADHPASDPTVPIILADTDGPLLSEPVTQPQPVSALLHALIPESRSQVLPSEQTQWLSRWLPLSNPVGNLRTQ